MRLVTVHCRHRPAAAAAVVAAAFRGPDRPLCCPDVDLRAPYTPPPLLRVLPRHSLAPPHSSPPSFFRTAHTLPGQPLPAASRRVHHLGSGQAPGTPTATIDADALLQRFFSACGLSQRAAGFRRPAGGLARARPCPRLVPMLPLAERPFRRWGRWNAAPLLGWGRGWDR